MGEHRIEVLEVLEEPQPSWFGRLTRPFRRQVQNDDGHQDEARPGESLLERVGRPFRQFQQRRREAQARRDEELMNQAFEALRRNSGVTDFLRGTRRSRDTRRETWNWVTNCPLVALYHNVKKDQQECQKRGQLIGEGLWTVFYLVFSLATFILLMTK